MDTFEGKKYIPERITLLCTDMLFLLSLWLLLFMTKSITRLLILLLLLPVAAGAQLSCGMPWPPENKRPDTITTFRIADLTIPVRQLPGVRATSDFSFKAKHFDLLWAPVSTRNIHEFIRSTVRGSDPKQPVDTLHCTLGTKDYIVIAFSYNRKNKLLLYQDRQGSQDILLVTLKREKYRPEAFRLLSDYLHE